MSLANEDKNLLPYEVVKRYHLVLKRSKVWQYRLTGRQSNYRLDSSWVAMRALMADKNDYKQHAGML